MKCALHQISPQTHCVDAFAALRAQADRLPLHEAAANQASEEVIRLLLQAHPEAAKAIDSVRQLRAIRCIGPFLALHAHSYLIPAPSIGGLLATAAGSGEERKHRGGGGTATDLSRGRGHNGFIIASHVCRQTLGGQSIIGVSFEHPRQRCAAICSRSQRIGGQTEGAGA